MKKCLRIFAAFLLVAFLGATAWIVFGPSRLADPISQDKPLSKWLDVINPLTQDLTGAAAFAIGQMGTNAFPYLLEEAGAEDSEPKELLLLARDKGLLGSIHVRSSEERMERAARGFRALGPVGFEAAIQGLTNSDKNIRRGCAAVLLMIGKPSTTLIQPLIKCLGDADEGVRAQAVATLGSLAGLNPEIIVSALIPSLNDKEASVRSVTVYYLGTLGNKARPAVPALLKLMSAPGPDLRSADIGKAIKSIDPEAAAKAGIK